MEGVKPEGSESEFNRKAVPIHIEKNPRGGGSSLTCEEKVQFLKLHPGKAGQVGSFDNRGNGIRKCSRLTSSVKGPSGAPGDILLCGDQWSGLGV